MSVTLHLGDCLDFLPSIRSSSVDAVITDPPYGINTKSDGSGKLSPWADLCNASHWYAAWLAECRRMLKPSGCLWSCLNWRSLVTFQKAACDIRWPIESLLVWDKEWIGPGGAKGLRPSYEMVALWAMPEFAIPDRGIPDVVRVKWASHKPTGHPAEKPVELVRFLIATSELQADATVVDPFMGSGTTGVAAVERDLSFVGCEVDAMNYEMSRRRIAGEQSRYALLESVA